MSTRVAEYGSEFDWDSNHPFESVNESRGILDATAFLRSGRDALKVVAQDNLSNANTVLLPALSCGSMVSPFTENGYKVVFFSLGANYCANVEDVFSKLTNQTILVYINYFGMQSISESDLRRVKQKFPSCILVEDRTHDLLVDRVPGFAADYKVASIRKWLSIPEGGLLWTKRGIHADCSTLDSNFVDVRMTTFKLKSEYLASGEDRVKSKYRRLQNEASCMLDGERTVYGMSDISRQILRNIDFNKLIAVRQKNVSILKSHLQPLANSGLIRFVADDPEKSTLYFPILLPNEETRDMVQKLAASSNVYCPVIWPIPYEATVVCETAGRTAKRMLGIPCDQRYDINDMHTISDIISEIIHSVSLKRL